MDKLKKEHVQNALDSFKEHNPELKDFILVNSDGRLGKKIALAKGGLYGNFETKTDYMTYSEMNMFLYGYYIKGEKRFEK